MDTEDQHRPDDESLSPSPVVQPTSLNPEPGQTNTAMQVPQDIAQAGHDTNEPHADSPESLDQELAEGGNREQIDPHHSIVRPEGVDTIDQEANGAD
jgi:hypothetical protein